ncbi:hypothetical protein ACOACO_07270 [Nocardioides sp. CPCC 205120]
MADVPVGTRPHLVNARDLHTPEEPRALCTVTVVPGLRGAVGG